MFLNPTILPALGAAAIPLVLHLLARARHRNIDWAAMMFLAGAAARQSHTARLKQYALLALRTGIIALLALALARPVIRGRWAGPAADRRITAVLVLDRSYSMAFEEAGRSRFDKAREAALQVLASLRRGDEVALVLLGEEVEVREPTANLPAIVREITDLRVSNGTANIAQGIAVARKILEQPGRDNRELYIITDRQAISWASAFADPAAFRWIGAANPPIRFYAVPVGSDDADNVAIEAVHLPDSLAIRGQSVDLEVRVRNYAPAARAGMELRISVLTPGDQRRQLKTAYVSAAPQGTTTVRVPVVFDQSGSHVLSAEINAPGLAVDNRFDTPIDVIDPIETLLISGDETGPEPRRESFFPRLALAPHQTLHRRAGDPVKLTIKGAEEWPGLDLSPYRVIILANVPQITPEAARALEQKVYEGAGLIVAPGSLSRIDAYNRILYRDGLGLLPARLDPPTPADGSDATALASVDALHPLFHFRHGGEPLPAAVIGRYFPAIAAADAHALATYSSGRPFLLENVRGHGRVLLLTTSLDGDWNTLPLYSFYLPFLQSVVRHAAAPTRPPRNLRPGDPLLASFDEPIDEARLERSGARLAVILAAGGAQVRCAETQRPGIYRLRARTHNGPWQTLHFIVQIPREESDLTAITDRQWRLRQRELGFVRLDPLAAPIADAVAGDRGGRELWLILLIAAMLAGVLELWVQRAWSREVAT